MFGRGACLVLQGIYYSLEILQIDGSYYYQNQHQHYHSRTRWGPQMVSSLERSSHAVYGRTGHVQYMAHLVNLTGLMRCPSREPFNLTAHPQPTKWPTAYRRNRGVPDDGMEEQLRARDPRLRTFHGMSYLLDEVPAVVFSSNEIIFLVVPPFPIL